MLLPKIYYNRGNGPVDGNGVGVDGREAFIYRFQCNLVVRCF